MNGGSSVASSQYDALEGTVTARSGDSLTMRGVTLMRRAGSVVFERGTTTVLVSADTKVTKAGQPGDNFGVETLSVGQRMHVFGDATEAANGDVTLEASKGRVRLQMTHLAGLVNSASTGLLAFNLQSIEGRRISLFDFSGTGQSATQDADPTDYEVATGNLTLSGLDLGAPVRVFGFVTPFGLAPPDFEGRTVVDLRNERARLSMGWGSSGTSAPFLSADAGGIVIDAGNSDIGARHFIAIGPTVTDIEALGAPPRIVAASDDGVFAIGQPHRVEVFNSFADFTAALNSKLSGGGRLIGLHATGHFDVATSEFSSRRVLAAFR